MQTEGRGYHMETLGVLKEKGLHARRSTIRTGNLTLGYSSHTRPGDYTHEGGI